MHISVAELIENAKLLSVEDRAFLAKCLISSLDTPQDESVDQMWAEEAKKRFKELQSGQTASVSWDVIKKDITS